MKQKAVKRISSAIAFMAALAFVVKFAGPAILRLYVEFGVGNCKTIPILCMAPEEKIIIPGPISKGYIQNLIPYNFPKMTVSVPKGFSVTQERITKDYYRKKSPHNSGAAVYVLYEEKDFFVNLFPQIKKRGINDNYEFIKRTMYARIKEMTNVTDMFFIIMKGVFSPDLGNQRNVKMAQFRMSDRRGFINYNLAAQQNNLSSIDKSFVIASPAAFGGEAKQSRFLEIAQPVTSLSMTGEGISAAPRNDGRAPVNYFDCNVIKNNGDFFKLYIKDEAAQLDLNWVLAIISTLDTR
ncbi:MAG: hypothetical protein V1925_05005 [Candidatus Omnitrophota bacterium]